MIYSEPLFNQISRFVTSIGFGFIICILYLALVFLRTVISDRKWAIVTQDIVFGIITTVVSFFFMVIHNNGEVRWNLVLGEFLGAGVLYFTVGKYVMKFLEKFAKAIRRIASIILLPITLYIRAFPKVFMKVFNKIKSKTGIKKAREKAQRKKEE